MKIRRILCWLLSLALLTGSIYTADTLVRQRRLARKTVRLHVIANSDEAADQAQKLRVRDGVFTVIAHNNSAADKYIQRVKLNGEPYAKPYIGFEEIAAGGTLEFEMGPEPAVWYEL